MKILHLDLISGLSGDMFLGGLVHLGADLEKIEQELSKLHLHGYHLHAYPRSTRHIQGVKVDVHLEDHEHPHADEAHDHSHAHEHAHDHHQHHVHPHESHHDSGHYHHERTFAQICDLIEKSKLSPWVKHTSINVFHRLAEAEGKVHGIPPEKVHFHEVGAVDSIVDIVGSCIGLELLGCPQVTASAVVEGRGWVECAHGRFPVPTPATLEILAKRGVTLKQCNEPQEMLTPTGAALLTVLAVSFGDMPPMALEKVGYGLGSRELVTRPNCVRMILGQVATQQPSSFFDWETDQVAVLETNVDDLNPEILGHFLDKAFEQGALDVFYTPVTMKKNRPGVMLTLLCTPDSADTFAELIFRETSTFGVRFHLASRRKLQRNFHDVSTPWGPVKVKEGWLNGTLVQCSPEFESCRRVAEKNGVPVRRVYANALSTEKKLKALPPTSARKQRRGKKMK